ncbi:MAG: hypothetical protein LBP76_09860 [Treponema sp.]|nr:hypothetical protein [Treponema sp.]
MNKRINFENNIFILNERIRLLRDILSLETDPEIFLEKTVDDIYFISRTLDILLNILNKNKHLIERDTQFDNLSELEWQFCQVLSGFLSGTGIIAGSISDQYRDTIVQVRGQSQKRQEIIGDSIGKGSMMSGEPLVSYDELSELLKDF